MISTVKERAISPRTLPDEWRRADDFNRMSARKLLYRFMVFAPAIFLVGIGVHARTISRDFEFVESDPESERQLLAYSTYMRAETPFEGTNRKTNVGIARLVAQKWISGAEKHDLKPLSPSVYEDTSGEGAKSQIFDRASRVTQRLVDSVGESARKGDFHQATADAVLAIRFSNILKFSDFLSLFNSSNEQRVALQFIKLHLGQLDASDRRSLALALDELRG